MEAMFNNAKSFNGDVSNWQTGSVTTFKDMFMNATRFNRPIAGWNRNGTGLTEGELAGGESLSTVTQFNSMFEGALAFDQDLSSWDYRKYCDPGFSDGANPDWSQERKPQFVDCESLS
jgi:surface protein